MMRLLEKEWSTMFWRLTLSTDRPCYQVSSFFSSQYYTEAEEQQETGIALECYKCRLTHRVKLMPMHWSAAIGSTPGIHPSKST